MKYAQTQKTIDPLEYAAILSGLGMAGDTISDKDIEYARHLHTNGKAKKFSFVSLVASTKHSA